MNAAGPIASALRRVGGQAVLLLEDGSRPTFPASIQPVRAAPSPQADSLGVARPRRAVLFAPGDGPAADLKAEALLASGGITYRVLQAEVVFLGEAPAYTWAMLEVWKEEELP